MKADEKIQNRITQLINEADELARGHGEENVCANQTQISECIGWLAAAQSMVELACPPPHAYRIQFGMIMARPSQALANERVDEAAALLSRLQIDMHAGLIASIVDQAAAETFDDFLDHADAYLREGRKEPAGVIAGVVFEDTIRRICRKNGIADADQNLDDLIAGLQKSQVFSGMKAKRARAEAHVRNKATHAQWNEFEAGDVESTVKLTRELLDEHLE